MEDKIIMFDNSEVNSEVKQAKKIQFITDISSATVQIIKLLSECNDCIMFNINFYIYKEGYWQKEEENDIIKLIQEFAKEYGFESKYYEHHKKAKDLFEQARLDLYSKFTPNKNTLNFLNGTLELNTLEFREHRKEDYNFNILPYSYDPNAKCPNWNKFLDEILPDKKVQEVFQEVVAYPICGINLEKIGYLVGGGRNGKSVCLDVISEVFGKENVSHVPLDEINKNDGKAIQQMLFKLINISNETNASILNSAVFKSYASNEPLIVKYLYKDTYTSNNYPSSILAANSLPQSNDFSNGFFRRLKIIPFDVTIPEDKINPNLKNELCNELAGIFNWVHEGIKRLRENKRFSYSKVIEQTQNEFRNESDNVSMFIEDYMYVPSLVLKQLLSEIYSEYCVFANNNGYKKISNKNFSNRLRLLGFNIAPSTGNKTYVWIEKGFRDNETKEEIIEMPMNKNEKVSQVRLV